MRTPSPLEALQVINKCLKVPIDTVIDIGVQARTDFLISAFPASHHLLFEPVVAYHEMIRQHYSEKNILHTLVGSAVSDQAGVMYQHLLSSDMSGRVTHSQLLPCPDPVRFGSRLLEIVETPVVSLDHWTRNNIHGTSYAVKIDVDGIEDKIIAGGGHTIAAAVLLIVETHLDTMARRIKSLEEIGMKLFDIVGNGYYFGQLQQVDLVFVAERVVKDNIDFQPWKKAGKVIWDEWQQIS
jgi:FkbM family methyltransferase